MTSPRATTPPATATAASPPPTDRSAVVAGVVLALAGAALVAYPALRGYAVEDGLPAAELYARPAWLWAHVLGMAGFVLVAWGLAAVDAFAHRAALVGAILLLPYYGAEAYGLHALGRRVIETGDVAMVARGDGAADLFRYEPVAMTLFAFGWVALFVVAIRLAILAVRSWRTAPLAAFGMGLTALAYATYLPQFFTAGEVRIAHGGVAGVGLAVLALAVARGRGARKAGSS